MLLYNMERGEKQSIKWGYKSVSVTSYKNCSHLHQFKQSKFQLQTLTTQTDCVCRRHYQDILNIRMPSIVKIYNTSIFFSPFSFITYIKKTFYLINIFIDSSGMLPQSNCQVNGYNRTRHMQCVSFSNKDSVSLYSVVVCRKYLSDTIKLLRIHKIYNLIDGILLFGFLFKLPF